MEEKIMMINQGDSSSKEADKEKKEEEDRLKAEEEQHDLAIKIWKYIFLGTAKENTGVPDT
jgi:hypothetical protein